jgi:hypothetical protein
MTGWIATREKMPPDLTDVLTVALDGDIDVNFGRYYKNGTWEWATKEQMYTHWMPLPEAPHD